VTISRLIKGLLNVKDIIVKDVKFELENGVTEVLVVSVNLPKRKRNRCPECGKKCSGYDEGNGTTRWRALDLGIMKVYIEAPAPRIMCKKHGVLVAKVPWARHDSWFTYDFEQTVAWLVRQSNHTVVSNLMRIDWRTVGSIVSRVVKDIEDCMPNRYDNLARIGIDETSYKKGHKYMTVVVDHEKNALIWAAKGHGKQVLTKFFKSLTDEQRASIKFVSADGAGWIADCVGEYCANAERCIDPFHVVGWAQEELDNIRKESRKQSKENLVEVARRKPGRPRKGKEPKAEEKVSLRGLKYSLLKNPENLHKNQQTILEMIEKNDNKLYRAYKLKEDIRLIFQLSYEDAAPALDAWIKWAQHCRIPEFVELQRKIRRHKDAILAAIKHGLSNARIEAINNKIKLTIRMGYGFRNIDNLIKLLMLRCGNMPLDLPGRV
jgi:transposase